MKWLSGILSRISPKGDEARDRSTRYEGAPMLRLLECYALDVIGHLSPDQVALAEKIVHHTWGGDDWRVTLRQVLAWPDTVDEEIRHNWSRYQEAARETEPPGDYGPEGFAVAFADEFSQ